VLIINWLQKNAQQDFGGAVAWPCSGDDLLGGDALMLGCALAFSEAFSLGFFLRLLPQASKMNEHPTPHSSEVDH